MDGAAKPLLIRHLHLENWRNFTRVEVDLERRVLLAGPNASGKTNFLDALHFLHDIVAGGGFPEAVERRGGVSRLRCLNARQPSHIAIAAALCGDDGIEWEYDLAFSQDEGGEIVVSRERATRDGTDLFVRPDHQDRDDPERLKRTWLEQVGLNREFRQLAGFFASIRYVREPHRLVEQIAATPESVQRLRLGRIREALRAAVPQLDELELWCDLRGAPHLRARYAHWRSQGAWQTEEQFSHGTLRLIALIWAVLDGSGPLLLEEPELALHPEVVRQILPMLDAGLARQILFTTHSPDLLRGQAELPDQILLMVPSEEGTLVLPATSAHDMVSLLEGALGPAGEAAAPQLDQLDLWRRPRSRRVT